jgi:hypothetical protein
MTFCLGLSILAQRTAVVREKRVRLVTRKKAAKQRRRWRGRTEQYRRQNIKKSQASSQKITKYNYTFSPDFLAKQPVTFL